MESAPRDKSSDLDCPMILLSTIHYLSHALFAIHAAYCCSFIRYFLTDGWPVVFLNPLPMFYFWIIKLDEMTHVSARHISCPIPSQVRPCQRRDDIGNATAIVLRTISLSVAVSQSVRAPGSAEGTVFRSSSPCAGPGRDAFRSAAGYVRWRLSSPWDGCGISGIAGLAGCIKWRDVNSRWQTSHRAFR